MEFRLELIHGAQVHSPDGSPLPLRSYKGILSALGYSDEPLPREDVIGHVWPEVTLPVGRNRLRVALVKLRSLMPGAIVETEEGLRLDPAIVASDAADVRVEIERSQDSVTSAGEFEALSAALAAVGDGTAFDRYAPGASEFGEMLARYWLRVSELAGELSNFERSAEAAKTATRFDIFSADAWVAYLQTHWRIGSAKAAIEETARRAPAQVQSDPNVQAALKQIRSKDAGIRERVTSDRRSFWFDIIESIEDSRPDLMRAILSSPQTLSISGKQPRIMHDMLEKVTPLDLEEKDSIWERSAARMIGLKAWLGDAKGVLESAPAVLESSKDVQISRAVWNAVAIAHSLVRDWDSAYDAIDRTMEFSRQMGSEMYELTTVGNAAFFKMQQARFEEAAADYAAMFDRLLEIDTDQSKFEYAIAIGNRALIPVFKGEWEDALSRLETAMEIRTKGKLMVHMGTFHAATALVKTNLGRMDGVVNSMRLAFLDAFHSDSFRSQQFTFDMAAAAIAVLGDVPFAQSLSQWTEKWRQRTHAPRSDAEQMLVSRFPAGRRVAPLPEDPAIVGKEAMKRLRTLVAQR